VTWQLPNWDPFPPLPYRSLTLQVAVSYSSS